MDRIEFIELREKRKQQLEKIRLKLDWKLKLQSLYGETWKAQLAKMASLNPRTVRRYSSGEAKIRPELVDKINKTYNIWREDEREI